jgi:RNA polymerase sigma-70 factor (ECF subfamily)
LPARIRTARNPPERKKDGGRVVTTAEAMPSADVAAVQAGDEAAFAVLVERHRRELHVHCYRMLGSFDEAEDLVQEVFLRAWRGRAGFAGRSTIRAWLYRIATNLCLDASRRHSRRPVAGSTGPPPVSELPWLQPYPDRLLAEIAPRDAEPDAMVVAKETIELAFLAAIQLLPPRQRAVLILRDVLGWPAAETAALLDATVAGVNSALQRARGTLHRRSPGGRLDWAPATDPSEQERVLLQRYMDAHERVDPAAVVALLREDARLAISPDVGCWDGREAIAATLEADMGSLGHWRMLPTRANRQPAAAGYLRRWGDSEYRAFVLVVLRVENGVVAEIAAFERPDLFPAFGLAPVLR